MSALHLQQILWRFAPDYLQQHRLTPQQHKVLGAISACRTDALGGQWVRCEHCGFEQQRHHSCRNRHCPQCQGYASAQWCEQQLQKVLPTAYFHVVFTLPHALNPWISRYPALMYRLLFHIAWQTIKDLGADPKRLNGRMGMVAVLHTWGQNLSRHVHLHCLIPGGALSQDGTAWHAASSTYLFPVRVLSRLFRGKMVSALRHAWQQQHLARIHPGELRQTLDALMKQDWVVYSRTTLRQADTVVKYLSRYTYRIAISEQRLLSMDAQQVRFAWHDYRDGKDKALSLDGEEFLRRYLLHVLPKGLMRIRHYGFMANRCYRQCHAQIRRCLALPKPCTKTEESTIQPSACLCPRCHRPSLQVFVAYGAARLTEG